MWMQHAEIQLLKAFAEWQKCERKNQKTTVAARLAER